MPLSSSRLFLAICLSTLPGNASWAQQSPKASEPAFETASIRPSHTEAGCFSILPPGGAQYAVTCVTLRNLIAMAWKLHPDDIQGGDAQALGTYYDLRATTPEGQLWTRDTFQPMLRQLLIERFHLAVHRGTKQINGFSLIVAKGGPKLKTAEFDATQQGQKAGESFQNYIVPGAIHGRGANLNVIASLLSSPAHATVVDHTGLSGVFNVDLHYAYEGGNEPNLPDFFVAVEEQLGLKLQSEKITVDTLVIDHTDSEPTAN